MKTIFLSASHSMRLVFSCLLLSVCAAAQAGGMKPVPEKERSCHEIATFCYEWILIDSPDVRFMAYGDEDGIDYSFYRKGKRGHYRRLIRIYPVIRDDSRGGDYFWGYPWDISDIAEAPNGTLQVAFDHNILDEGESRNDAWQKKIPAVLFIGRTTQPDMTKSKFDYRPMTFPQMKSAAKR
jgi:hypothetical protein